MGKVRVFELARELNMQSKDLVNLLNELGVKAKNHMSSIDENAARYVMRKYGPDAEGAKPGVEQEDRKAKGPAQPAQAQQAAPAKKREQSPPKARRRADQEGGRGRPSSQVYPPSSPRSAGGAGAPGRDFPRPAGDGARTGERQRDGGLGHGSAQQPPRSQQASPAKPVRGRQQPDDRRRREDYSDDELKRRRTDRKADRRGRKKPPTSRPLGDAKELGRMVRTGDIDDIDEVSARRRGRRREKAPKVKRIEVGSTISVREFAAKLEISASECVRRLVKLGVMVRINDQVEGEIAQVLASELGFEAELTSEREERELIIAEIEDTPESLKARPPVVTIMGHVDHGKTSLLDAIREANVTATEAGGITQHIGAYQVEMDGKKITFLDTPGHEAFTAMRARGAHATDIAVLVVAADDGVMPQTVEAINHAKDAKVPIIVAVNKIDKPEANPERVETQLSERGLVPEKWGGDTVMVPVSALKRQGIEDLLEMVLLMAEMGELKANPDRPAMGVVIEAKVDRGRGPVATVLIQKGTLRVGDYFLVGEVHGRVRAMADYKGRTVQEATPSMPVEVLGLSDVPLAGDAFQVVIDEREARQVAARRAERRRIEEIGEAPKKVSLEDLFSQIKEGEVKELRVIIKADVQGSVEAVRQAIEQLSTDEVCVDVIHGGVGAISESDIMLASASNAVVIGFNVRPDAVALMCAEDEKVDVRLYRVIYEAIDDVKKALEGLLDPEYREVVYGQAEVRATFKVPRAGVVAGCYITEGKVPRNASVRVVRDGIVEHEGKIASLRRFKDDVKEVVAGFECGIGIEDWNDVREGDIIEAYGNEEIRREL
ncbi:MAG: translation initiation factor IF-2 [Firmicutes bacterium]|jgi:translation initiation factor IF-2|nr:translation initiation factor IF-2 [Bacillota bacterium]MDD4791805.1 translation initiation factor IF-2 [Bacillota bacterium]